jgi:cation-transporting ATPase 13A1
MEVPVEGMEKSGRLYRPSMMKRVFWASLLVALYAIVVPYCYNTAGEPRAAAARAAQEKADAKWEGYNNATTGDAGTGTNAVDEAALFGEDTSLDMNDLLAAGRQSSGNKTSGAGGFLSGWFGPSKEDKRAKKQQEEMIKRFNKAAEEAGEGPMSLPPTYLPNAWACLAMFATLSLHALFFLLGHWMVGFKAWSLYDSAKGKSVDKSCFLLVIPPANRGKEALVPLGTSSFSDGLQVEFQRQTYTYTPSSKLGVSGATRFPNGVFSLSSCPVNLPLTHYIECPGHVTNQAVDLNTERWGKNHLSIKIPGFLELLQSQLLSPLAIFQVFCAMLWLLDEYWTYTLWSLVSVVIFEATTVFQRTRTQKMLGGMTPPPAPIYVFRQSKWTLLSTKELLPGDLISVAYKRATNTKAVTSTTTADGAAPAPAPAPAAADAAAKKQTTTTDAAVPCDCLLLRGACVVNESSLTGESVPQMKESIAPDSATARKKSGKDGEEEDKGTSLDMNGEHRVSTLFSGTTIVSINTGNDTLADAAEAAGSAAVCKIPLAPDHGCVAYVLRTGFSSSQGTLFQMIEFSQQSVAGDLKETGYALLLLVAFALVAAAYVLKEGLEKKEKTTHELLLKCVIIITSVVPRQFPMQMAMAVNMALMALVKGGIYCTEPFRVPYAGKITHCLFDKTGTLTTDQLVPVGVVNNDGRQKGNAIPPGLNAVKDASEDATVVLAGCHSLVAAEDEVGSEGDNNSSGSKAVVGDPIEVAAMQGVRWRWDAEASTARPGVFQGKKRQLDALEKRRDALLKSQQQMPANVPAAQRTALTAQLNLVEENVTRTKNALDDAVRAAALCSYQALKVVHRNHFSSALQRMSVVAVCADSADGAGVDSGANMDIKALVKGSPEAVGLLLAPGAKPAWYTRCYEGLAKKGLRVLALAYKDLPTPKDAQARKNLLLGKMPADWRRETIESELQFGGFIAFECKIRADSKIVVSSLSESGHKVAMLTGDALLTSVHVAKEVNIVDKERRYAALKVPRTDNDSAAAIAKAAYWEIESTDDAGDDDDDSTVQKVVFDANAIPLMAAKHDLVCVEKDFDTLANATGGDESPMWTHCGHFSVLARMSPHGKAAIIRAIQKADGEHNVLMCGDGGNDVGALKQAEVGVALLAGHANTNTTDAPSVEKAGTAVVTSDKGSGDTGASAEDALNAHQEALKKRADEVNKLRLAHMKAFQAKYQVEAQAILKKKVEELTAKGELTAMWGLMKGQAGEMKAAMAKENARFMAANGQVWDPKTADEDGTGGGGGGGLMDMLGGMDVDDASAAGGVPQIRPGDASVAAPFTSRTPSVRAVIDLIRQGRCTLLSALMQQQIMMLESIIAAYTLSALSLHNARSSERQMMASSWLIMTAAVSFSYSTPVDKMHPERPLRSLFHPAIIFSILGQAIIHIACMSFAVSWATEAMGPEKLQEVTDFFRKAKNKEIDAAAACDEDDMMCQFQAYWMAPFLPNLLNSTVFLVETAQMISVFFANYKGRPWMKGMLENHALFLSVFLCIGGVVVASWEMVPQLNDLIQLAPFPDDTYRYKVVLLVMATIAGTFIWDRLMTVVFAPRVAKAAWAEASKTQLSDLAPVGMTALKVVGGIALLGSGNLVVAGMAYYYYRNYYNKPAATPAPAAA